MKKEKSLVSVLLPAYNAEKYIGEAIESILNQTYQQFELIIADDASTDETWITVQTYVKRDKRISAIRNKKNLNIAENRNKLVSVAKGEYIAWQDADDISLPDRLEKQVSYLENHPVVGIVGGSLEFFQEWSRNTSIRKYAEDDYHLRKNIFKYSPVAQPTAMIRKVVFSEIGRYDLNYPTSEDLDMSFRIGEKYKFANLQEVTLKYRVNLQSATYNKLKNMEMNTLAIRKKYAKSGFYSESLSDRVYNFLQWVSVYIIPSYIKIWLFTKIRNTQF